jgi:hypothetical protein
MPTTLSTSLNLILRTILQDASATENAMKVAQTSTVVQTLANGTDEQQADIVWASSRTLASLGSETHNLSSLTDALGNTIAFRAVKLLYIRNRTDSQTLTIGNAATRTWDEWSWSATSTIRCGPGSVVMLWEPLWGWDVISGVTDFLKIENENGSATQYDITIVGTSVDGNEST